MVIQAHHMAIKYHHHGVCGDPTHFSTSLMNSKFMEVMQGCKVDVDQHHKQVHVALQCHDELTTQFMWDRRTAATFHVTNRKNHLELTRS